MNEWVTTKKKYAVLLIFFLTGIIISRNFLMEHYATDTYTLYVMGYSSYSRIFVQAARFASAISLLAANALSVSVAHFMIIMGLLAQAALSSAAFILWHSLAKIKRNCSSLELVGLGLAAFITIYNPMTMENLLFAESGIMCTGILLVVTASVLIQREGIKNWICSFLLMLAATFFYQGILNFYVPVAFLMVLYKNKENIKKYIYGILRTGFIYLSALLFNYLIIKVVLVWILKSHDRRASGVVDLYENVSFILLKLPDILYKNLNLMPPYVYLFALLFLVLFTFINIFAEKNRYILLLSYLLIFVSAFGCSFLPTLLSATNGLYTAPRLLGSIGGLIGMTLIFILLHFKVDFNKLHGKLLSLISLGWALVLCMSYIQCSTEHLLVNHLDKNYIQEINERITIYEQTEQIQVNKIALRPDMDSKWVYEGMTNKDAFNVRGIRIEWASTHMFSVYCDRNIVRTAMPAEVFDKYFKDKDWTVYSDEQVVFIGDTVYVCIY